MVAAFDHTSLAILLRFSKYSLTGLFNGMPKIAFSIGQIPIVGLFKYLFNIHYSFLKYVSISSADIPIDLAIDFLATKHISWDSRVSS